MAVTRANAGRGLPVRISGLISFDEPLAHADVSAFFSESPHSDLRGPWPTASIRCDCFPADGAGATCSTCGVPVLSCAGGRVDNRLEISRALNARLLHVPDGELLARAYSTWGADCAQRLDGDWVVAAYCRACRRLDLLRDAAGSSQLYYANAGRTFAFSTDIRQLSRCPRVSRTLDEVWLAKHLVGWLDDTESATAFRAIRKVPPAHRLTVRPEGPSLARYWSTQSVHPLVLKDEREYADALQAALTAAVRSRLPGSATAGSMLSAGLDSSAVTALASREAARASLKLLAFTHVPDTAGLGPPLDEGPAAGDLIATLQHVQHEWVQAHSWTPVRALRRAQEVFGVPGCVNMNTPFAFATLERAQRHGVSTLLTGQLGNLTMNWGRRKLGGLVLLRSGHYREIARRLIPPALRAFRLSGFDPSFHRSSPWARTPIRAGFADSLDLRRRIVDSGREPHTLIGPRQSNDAVLTFAAGQVGAIYAQLHSELGVAQVDPYSARSLLECVASFPDRVWVGPQDRSLFRDAMVGILPDTTRLRAWKGVQSADFASRLAARPDELAELFDELDRSPLTNYHVDLAWCRAQATALVANTKPDVASLTEASWLMPALDTALFLSRIDRGGWGSHGEVRGQR